MPSARSQLTFGMGPVALDEEGSSLRRRFGKLLANALGVKVTIVTTRTYARLLTRAERGDLDLAWLPPAIFVRLVERVGPTRLLLGSARATEGHYHGALFVKPDSPIRTADDLAGRSVGWVDRNSCAGYLFPRFALAEKRHHPTSLLGEEQFLRSHGATIQAVDAGHVDVGATYVHLAGGHVVRSGWMDAGLEMRAVLTSRSIPVDVVAALKKLGSELEGEIVSALADLHDDREGAAVLNELLGVRRFEPVEAREYEIVRAALNVAHLPLLMDH